MLNNPAARMDAPERRVPSWNLWRVVLGVSAGTVFEAYDFILFGSLAPIIARHFFAIISESAAFIVALLTFAAGFAVRPLGALLFGRMGDRHGRKRTFLITITLMGASTFSIGLLPSYSVVGVFAPAALIALRMLQGLAYGGEYGGAVIYVAEHAPHGQRGLYVGWVQSAAGFALFSSFLVIYLARSALGEAAFEAWGWRVPFLISIGLLALSLWIRLTLEESPVFRRMVEEGRRSKAPLREAFLEWANLKLVLLVLFSLMAVQGVVFYTAHFYSQFFLTQILKVDGRIVTFVMMIVTATSVLLYAGLSWLSDRIGRKPIILCGTILSIVTAFPIFHALTAAANPAVAAAQNAAPVVVVSNHTQCSLQFDPVGQSAFSTSCDIAKAALAQRGLSYSSQDSEAALAVVRVGQRVVESVEGRDLDAVSLAAARARFSNRLDAALEMAGYPKRADTRSVNIALVTLLILLLVVFSTMVFAPMAAMAIEVFPARIRYSALSLPYHIGSGWFGGFLPAIAFSMVAATGDIYFGLWYPVVVAAIGAVVLVFGLPETKDREINHP